MKSTLSTSRYEAKALNETIDVQGRRRDWVASKAGISPAQLTRIANGTRTASREVADAIANALGVPFFVLFLPTKRADTDTEEAA